MKQITAYFYILSELSKRTIIQFHVVTYNIKKKESLNAIRNKLMFRVWEISVSVLADMGYC